MQISEVINNINVALNYPSATINDLKLYMDQAISELNSELHISIPSIAEMENEIEQYMSNNKDIVLIKDKPDSSTSIEVVTLDEDATADYFYNRNTNMFGIKTNDGIKHTNKLFGIYNDYISPPEIYQAVVISDVIVLWYVSNAKYVKDFNLEHYLTKDWIFLYFIPYVCFKYSVRDGDSGTLFAEEFSQGFQQLKNAYDIQSKVLLKNVCHLYAYRTLAKEHINNLNILVPTRAIIEEMKIPNGVKANWGCNFYSNGGWGL